MTVFLDGYHTHNLLSMYKDLLVQLLVVGNSQLFVYVCQLIIDILVTDGVSVLFNGLDVLLNNGGFLDFTGGGKSIVGGYGGGDGGGGGISNGSGCGGSVSEGSGMGDGGTVVTSMSVVDGSNTGKSTVDNISVGSSQDSGKNEL